MGNPNPSPTTRFKKGEPSANPDGGKLHTTRKMSKAFRELTEKELVDVMKLIVMCPPNELQEEVNENPTMLKQIIAAAMAKSVKNGDMSQLMLVLERIFGKVKQRVEVSGPDSGAIQIQSMPDDELEKRIESLSKD